MEKIRLEIRNETDKKLYVALCATGLMGNYFLHIDNKKSKHIPLLIDAHDYKIIDKPNNFDVA